MKTTDYQLKIHTANTKREQRDDSDVDDETKEDGVDVCVCVSVWI